MFVVAGDDDAAGAQRLEPNEETAGDEAHVDNTGDDSHSSEDLDALQVPRPSHKCHSATRVINTKPHAAILIGRRE